MITHLGRVVYDRKKHAFRESDVARILWADLEYLEPEFAAVYLVRVLAELWKKWGVDRFYYGRFIVTFLYELGKVAVFELGYVAQLLAGI